MLGGSHRLSFSLEAHEPAFFLSFECDTRRDNAKGEKKVHKNPYCRLVKRARSSLGRFVKHFRSNMSRAPRQSVATDGGRPTPGRHSVSMTPQQRCEQFGNSHQSEAIEDCINFLKNSSRKEVSTPLASFSTCLITSSNNSVSNNYYTCNSHL